MTTLYVVSREFREIFGKDLKQEAWATGSIIEVVNKLVNKTNLLMIFKGKFVNAAFSG